jgi:hypothetical protein
LTQEVLTVPHTEALDANCRRHNRTTHRHGFEGFDSRAASNPERYDRNLRFTDIGSNVIDKTGEGHTRA